MTYTDARTAAWAAAYESLDAARELRLALRQMDRFAPVMPSSQEEIDRRKDREDLERDIAGLLTEARIYTDLSAVSVEVGIATGDWVNRYHQIKAEREAQENLFGTPVDPPPMSEETKDRIREKLRGTTPGT
jgi:hypothetical protein